MNQMNRFKKIAEYREIDLNIKFKCECIINIRKTSKEINCKP